MIPADIHTHHPTRHIEEAVYNVTMLEEILPEEGWYSTGIHPWKAGIPHKPSLNELTQMAAMPRVVALGECGLDKHYLKQFDASQREHLLAEQTRLFEVHIELGETYEKPLIIHCVKAFNELVMLKRRHAPHYPWVIHGFRGNKYIAKELITEGFYLSFGEHFQTEALLSTPLTRLFIETDESQKTIGDILRQITLCLEITPDNLLSQLQNNVREVFRINNIMG